MLRIRCIAINLTSQRGTSLRRQQRRHHYCIKRYYSSHAHPFFTTPPNAFRFICYFSGASIVLSAGFFLRENLVFGFVAGLVAKTVTAPLERITTFRQASMDHKQSLSAIVKHIFSEEGMKGFFRGNGINIIRGCIQKGSLFALQDFYRHALFGNMRNATDSAHTTQTTTDSGSASSDSVQKNTANTAQTEMKTWARIKSVSDIMANNPDLQSLLISFSCGTLAGVSSTIITYPLDIVKTVNQSTIHHEKWPAVHVWYALYRSRGIRGMWVAFVPTLFGTGVYYGIKFCAFDAFFIGIKRIYDYRKDYKKRFHPKSASASASASVNGQMEDLEMKESQHEREREAETGRETWKIATAGALGGVTGNSVIFPNNCVRKRMQTAHVCHAIGADSRYKPMSYSKTVESMYKHEGGIKRFYNGFGVNLVRNAPNTALQFVIYKTLQKWWKSKYSEPTQPQRTSSVNS